MLTFHFENTHLKAIFIGGAAVGVGIYVCWNPSNWLVRKKDELFSLACARLAEVPESSPVLLRSQFTENPLILRKPVPGHTHGLSAAARSSGSLFIDELARGVGLGAYFVQCSRSDQKVGRAGSRTFYWSKDFLATHTAYAPPARSLLALVDVDYYVDMPYLLSSEFRPTVLYTFTPDEVAKESGEFSYTFDRSNQVIYRVAGGGAYTHRVWAYETDAIKCVRTFMGIPWQVSVFHVDKRRVDESHSMVLLSPSVRWTGLGALLAYFVSGDTLERLEPVEANFLRMKVQKADGLYVSTGEVGKYSCATVRAKYDDAIAISSTTTTQKLSLPTVLQYLPEGELLDRRAAASALLKYYRFRDVSASSRAWVFPVEAGVRGYDVGVLSFDPDAKQLMEPFMSPIIHGAFSPLASAANERQAIKGRVRDIAVKPGSLELSEFMLRAMNEFVELLFPEAGALHPATLDEVFDRQPRASQQAILERSLNEPAGSGVKSFMKREDYQDAKDGRIISTMDGSIKRDYSCFIYPLADHIKQMEWYAFGKTPEEIAERVVEVLASASSATNTDFSRFDGRVSDLLRMLERKVLVRAFDSAYVEEITELHNSQFNQSAMCTSGTRYETGTSRASGSPETAAFNSLANAFVAYLTFRMTRERGGYISPRAAWSRLGVYGGDDGLTADVDVGKYQKASAMLGLKLETELIARGDEGITFLSRMYTPQVWFGETASCCDLPRQLTKFHTTVHLGGVSPVEKLLEKSRAYFLSDKNTPVLGEFVRKVIELHGASVNATAKTAGMRRWNSELPEDKQYPNPPHEWFAHYSEACLEHYGFDFDLFREWLASCTCLEDCLKPPLCAEPKEPEVKVPIVVDGDVKEPKDDKAREGSKNSRAGKAKAKSKKGRPTGRSSKGKAKAKPPRE